MSGVRRILELFSERRIPLVGFECFMDLMFLYHWVVDYLPPTYLDFVRRCKDLFPIIADVRVRPVRKVDRRRSCARAAF